MPDAPDLLRAVFPDAGGEMAARCRAFDWAATPLGAVDGWPQSLRTAAALVVAAGFPSILLWGPELTQIYNDAYVPLLGVKHPAALGQRTHDCWTELREITDPLFAQVRGGRTVMHVDQAFDLRRAGPDAPAERLTFTFTYVPVYDEAGSVAGISVTVVETTDDVVGRAAAARQAFLFALDERLRPLADPDVMLFEAARALGERVGATRVGYAQMLPDGETSLVTRNYCSDGVRGIEGRYRVEDYSPALLPALRAGRTVARSDVARDPELTEAERAAHASLEIGSTVDVPLVKGGRLVAVLFMHHREGRVWSADELALLEAVAARTWDAAERARAEAERERALAAAEAANQAKSEFLAVMSHELRTPLNAIGGYAELIEMGIRGPVTPEQRADLARIQTSQRHLLGLINGVLNYARVEAGAVHYDMRDLALDDVLATCEALTAPQVHARGLTLTYDGVPGAGGTALRVLADREKLQQIVLNLLSNAVKFTAPGGRVTMRAEASGATVVVRITDTGVGIAPEHLSRVFEPFVQLDAKLTRTQEGTGLGLAISRDLARGMGGDLSATSAPGEGSTFTLTLPAAPARAE